MPSDTAMPMSRRAEELAYVTKHFRDMQGMVALPFVFTMLSWDMWVRADRCSAWPLWLLLPAVFLGWAAGRAIRRWYRQSFGFVEDQEQQAEQALAPSVGASSGSVQSKRKTFWPRSREWGGMCWLWISLMAISDHSDGHRAALYLLLPIMVFLLPRCRYSTPLIVTLQLRRAFSIAVMVLLLSLIGANLLVNESKWVLGFATCECFGLLVIYDHWLLMHLLGGRRGVEAFYGE